MNTKSWGIALVVLGVLMLAFVLLAGPLGINGAGFGTKHIIGAVVSAIVLIVGLILLFVSKPKAAAR